MKTTQYVRRSFLELNLPQRRKLTGLTAVQIANSLLDIFGVAFIGLMVAEAQGSGVSSSKILSTRLLPSELFGVSQTTGILLLVSAATFCFVLKAFVAPLMHRKILISLGEFSVNFSGVLKRKLFDKDLLFTQRRTTQETVFILTEGVFYTYQGILGYFALLVSELALVMFMIGLLLSVNLPLTLFVLLYFSSILYLLNRFSRTNTRLYSNILNRSLIGSRTIIQDSLNSYREIYVSQNIENFISASIHSLNDSVKSRAYLTWLTLLPKYVLDACIVFGMIIVGGIASFFTSQQNAISLCVLFLVSASRIMPSLLRLNTGFQGINLCSDGADRLYKFVEDLDVSAQKEIPFFDEESSFSIERIDISVKNLNFRYPESEVFTLKDLSFDVPFGEFLAIVGPSGGGKSTLVDLLMGVLNEPKSSIKIGGLVPRNHVECNPGLIGYVPQRVTIMNRTLKENIAIGIPLLEIDDAKVLAAVDMSALRDLVSSLPLGLNTIIEENGQNFSGGQIQRIGLARAMYTEPKILILDEATSALDAETEHAVSKSLDSLAGQMTLIVVAHRLATVRSANKILYLDTDGTFEMGTFEELRVKVSGFNMQAKLLGL
jgi:ABC-type multidrug transport system fused ATPase/permease subunit